MDVVLIFNGLGNQMSQYALYLNKKNNGQNVRYICIGTAHNGIELGRLFGIDVKMRLLDKILILLYHVISTDKFPAFFKPLQSLFSLLGIVVVREAGEYAYKQEVADQGRYRIRFLAGGWHHGDYFSSIENIVRDTYTFPRIIDKSNLELLNSISNCSSVAIHIRRGDYMAPRYYKQFGSVCTDQYYINAMNLIEKEVDSPIYYIFSNDKEYSLNLFKDKKYVFVDCNSGIDSWKDLILMSRCNYLVMSNSTFSWWAAWLKNMPSHIFRPPFFVNGDMNSNIYKDNWITINN